MPAHSPRNCRQNASTPSTGHSPGDRPARERSRSPDDRFRAAGDGFEQHVAGTNRARQVGGGGGSAGARPRPTARSRRAVSPARRSFRWNLPSLAEHAYQFLTEGRVPSGTKALAGVGQPARHARRRPAAIKFSADSARGVQHHSAAPCRHARRAGLCARPLGAPCDPAAGCRGSAARRAWARKSTIARTARGVNAPPPRRACGLLQRRQLGAPASPRWMRTGVEHDLPRCTATSKYSAAPTASPRRAGELVFEVSFASMGIPGKKIPYRPWQTAPEVAPGPGAPDRRPRPAPPFSPPRSGGTAQRRLQIVDDLLRDHLRRGRLSLSARTRREPEDVQARLVAPTTSSSTSYTRSGRRVLQRSTGACR